jgi:hypothetical protein
MNSELVEDIVQTVVELLITTDYSSCETRNGPGCRVYYFRFDVEKEFVALHILEEDYSIEYKNGAYVFSHVFDFVEEFDRVLDAAKAAVERHNKETSEQLVKEFSSNVKKYIESCNTLL